MKVGVVTFHSALNYGACLQTMALQKALLNMGVEPYVINYHSPVIDRLYDPIRKKNPILHALKTVKVSFTKPYHLRRIKKYKSFFREYYNLYGDYTSIDQMKDIDLDAFITGSDQVFNVEHTDGIDPVFFLDFVHDKRTKLSYAASLGGDSFRDEDKEVIKKYLSDFDAISVREEGASSAVQELTDRNVEVVPDPTFLLDKHDYVGLKKPCRLKGTNDGRYILVYMMEKNEELIALANKLSKETGLPIAQRSFEKVFDNETELLYEHDPAEFLSVIENAEFVLTNSFHGTALSAIFEKPFLSMLHSTTGLRVTDLLKELGLEDHILYNASEFKGLESFNIRDVNSLRQKKEELKEKGLKFLKESLNVRI